MYNFLYVSALILGAEVVVDWTKHAFITKFNRIPARIYSKYAAIIGDDFISHRRESGVLTLDPTHSVTQR